MFSNKSNLNLVLEFLDSDLEAVIRDKQLVFQQADVKSWMLMTMKGLDFCHRNWILHRVRLTRVLFASDFVFPSRARGRLTRRTPLHARRT